jgi:hypothetical protein
MKHNQEVMSNLKSKITNYLVGQNKSQFVVAKNIVCMFASSQLGCKKINGFAKALDVDRRNIKKAMERRLQLDIEKDAF